MRALHAIQFFLAAFGGALVGWVAIGVIQGSETNPSGDAPGDADKGSATSPILAESDTSMDLAGTIREIDSRPTPIEQTVACVLLASKLPGSEIRRTLEAKHLFPDHSASSILERLLLARWMEHAPEDAMSWALTNDVRSYDLAKDWARRDLESAQRFADSRNSEKQHRSMYAAMATALAGKDPREALDFIRDHPKSGTYTDALHTLARNDPVVMAARLDQLPPNHYAYIALAQVWAGNDPAAAFEWALSLDRPDLMDRVVGGVKDLGAALELIARLPLHEQANAASLSSSLRDFDNFSLARSRIEEAEGLSDQAREHLLRIVESETGRRARQSAPITKPPELARQLVEENHIHESAIQSHGDRQKLVDAIEALPAGSRIGAHYKHFDIVLRGGRFAECVKLLSHLPPDDPRTAQSVSELAVQWTQHHPVAATEWIAGLPAGTAKDWAAHNASRQWARINPDSAEAWFQDLLERGEVDTVTAD